MILNHPFKILLTNLIIMSQKTLYLVLLIIQEKKFLFHFSLGSFREDFLIIQKQMLWDFFFYYYQLFFSYQLFKMIAIMEHLYAINLTNHPNSNIQVKVLSLISRPPNQFLLKSLWIIYFINAISTLKVFTFLPRNKPLIYCNRFYKYSLANLKILMNLYYCLTHFVLFLVHQPWIYISQIFNLRGYYQKNQAMIVIHEVKQNTCLLL